VLRIFSLRRPVFPGTRDRRGVLSANRLPVFGRSEMVAPLPTI